MQKLLHSFQRMHAMFLTAALLSWSLPQPVWDRNSSPRAAVSCAVSASGSDGRILLSL